MNIQLIPDTFDKTTYNDVVKHPLQSWEWGEARKETGLKVIRVGVFENGILVDVYQMTIHSIPFTSWNIGYIPRSVLPTKQVLDFISQLVKDENIVFIKFEPNVLKDDTHNSELLTLNWVKSTHPLFPKWTQILDLTANEETLMKQMKSKTRYNVRLAQKKGVVVKNDSTDHGFETFSNLYFDTTKRQKYFGHSKKYHKIVWDNLKEGIAHIIIAYYNGKPLSAYELFFFKGTLYYPYGGSSNKHREVMASNLIMWEAIKLGKKLGATSFDMWGSLPPNYNASDSWSGFTRFKEGYGTSFVEFIGSFDLIVNPFVYKLYNISHKMRSILLNLST